MKRFIIFLFFLPSVSLAEQMGSRWHPNLQLSMYFNEGSGILTQDYSQNRSSAMIHGGAVWTTNSNGVGYRLDLNAGGYVTLSTAINHNVLTPIIKFTFFIRFIPRSFTGTNTLISPRTAAGGNKWLLHIIDGNPWIGYAVSACDVNYGSITGNHNFIELNVVNDIAVIYSNTFKPKLTVFARKPFSNDWRDREWRAEVSQTNIGLMCSTSPDIFYIGRYNAAGDNPFDVEIDELHYFDVAMSTSQLKGLDGMLNNQKGKSSE